MPKPAAATETVIEACAALERQATANGGGFPIDLERLAALRAVQNHANPLSEVRRLLTKGVLRKADVEVLFSQARLVGRAAAPVILDMLFEKAAYGESCPYDVDALTFLAKGFGVTSPNKPVDDLERAAAADTAATVASMGSKELLSLISAKVRASHDRERKAREDEKANRG